MSYYPNTLSLGGITLTATRGGVDVRTAEGATRLQAADLDEIIQFLIEVHTRKAS